MRFSQVFAAVAVLACGFAGCQKRSPEPETPADFSGMMALARRGNASAQFNVAAAYLSGNGVARDERAGVEWMAKAALGGDRDAQFNLGAMYAEGTHRPFVAKNIGDAIKWYHLAAENNHVEAQVNLALIYYYGVDGTPRNYEEAVKWFERAADQGDPKAQYLLGDCLYIGRGTKKDKTSAIELYRKSAQQGFAEASERLQSIRP